MGEGMVECEMLLGERVDGWVGGEGRVGGREVGPRGRGEANNLIETAIFGRTSSDDVGPSMSKSRTVDVDLSPRRWVTDVDDFR